MKFKVNFYGSYAIWSHLISAAVSLLTTASYPVMNSTVIKKKITSTPKQEKPAAQQHGSPRRGRISFTQVCCPQQHTHSHGAILHGNPNVSDEAGRREAALHQSVAAPPSNVSIIKHRGRLQKSAVITVNKSATKTTPLLGPD